MSRRKLRGWFTALLRLVVVLAGVPAWAQPHTIVSNRSACSGCRIELKKILTLGDTSGPGALDSDFLHVARDSRGRYLIAATSGVPSIKVFGSDGRYITAFGRRGQGPGEFVSMSAVVVGRGDTLYVTDDVQGRISVLSPSYRFLRSFKVPIRPQGRNTILLANGNLVHASPDRTPDRIGLPLHVIGTDGSIVRSFGSESGAYRPDIPRVDVRSITPAGDTEVWAAYPIQYVIERWDAVTGRKTGSLSRAVDWFPPQLTRRTTRSSETPPAPSLNSVHLDRDRRLWTLTQVADPNWRTGFTVRKLPRGDRHLGDIDIVNRDRYTDSYIEVIDPDAGRLLASQRFDPALWFFTADGQLVSSPLMPDGSPRIDIWEVRLHGR